MRSRVIPGRSWTMACRRPSRRLKRVDLPTLGRPTMATVGVSGMDLLRIWTEASPYFFVRNKPALVRRPDPFGNFSTDIIRPGFVVRLLESRAGIFFHESRILLEAPPKVISELLLAFLPLLPAARGGGWEKRAGVMRASAARTPQRATNTIRIGVLPRRQRSARRWPS